MDRVAHLRRSFRRRDGSGDDRTVEQFDAALHRTLPTRVVGHQKDGGPGGVQLSEYIDDGFGLGRVEVAGGLVTVVL